MPQHKDYYYVWRRSDGYVTASNGYQPLQTPSTTFELLADGEDWPTMRGVILIERAGLRVDEARRYRLQLTEQTRHYPWTRGEEAKPSTRDWTVGGAELRSLLWEFAAGDHHDLPETSHFDEAGYLIGGTDFYLRGIGKGTDLEVTVTVTAIPEPATSR
jgi:hypothetical protein